jgi:enterochelin esterase family protein
MSKKFILAAILAAACCTQVLAQPFAKENFPEGSYSPVTNVNRNGYPRVLKDGSVMFRVCDTVCREELSH